MNPAGDHWQLTLAGWPWWLVIPLALLTATALWRLAAGELRERPQRLRTALLLLRFLTAGVLVVLLLEPALLRSSIRTELPRIDIFLDTSASMAIADRNPPASQALEEAVALGLVPAQLRDTTAQLAGDLTEFILRDLPVLRKALGPDAVAAQREQALESVRKWRRELASLLPRLGAQEEMAGLLKATDELLTHTAAALEKNGGEGLTSDWLEWQGKAARLQAFCREAQQAADSSLLAGADADSLLRKGTSELARMSRYERVRRLTQQSLLPQLSGRAEVRVLRLQKGLEPLNVASPAGAPDRQGGQTDLEAPLMELARSGGDEKLGGVLVLSDGRQTAGGDPAPALRALQLRGVRVGAVAVGSQEPLCDASIAGITGTEEISPGETANVEVRFRISGYTGLPWDLILSRQGKDLERRTVSGTGGWQRERFEFVLKEPGIVPVQARLERPVPGTRLLAGLPSGGADDPLREASLDNNQADFMITVQEDPLRVLVVDAWPRWDTRYLVALLEKDSRVRLTRRYRLIRQQRGAFELLPPAQRELDHYDLLVFGDLRPEELGAEDQRHIADFVGRRGGFVVFLAGERGLPTAYGLGALAEVLPVRIAGSAAGAAGAPVRLRLTEEGILNPVTAVLKDPGINRELWTALPPLNRVARNVTWKKNAQALLVTADLQTAPVAVTMRYGAGKVLYLGTDETWRWRDRLGGRIHDTFWLQALRWGIGSRLRGKEHLLQVAVDRSVMEPEEKVGLRARALHADGSSAEGTLRVEAHRVSAEGNVESASRILEMSGQEDDPTVRLLSLGGLTAGRWRLVFLSSDPALKDAREERDLIVRRAPGQESVELSADPGNLERLMALGGGRCGGFGQAARIVEEVLAQRKPFMRTQSRTFSLWDSYLALGLVSGLLLLEWVLRRRNGMP